MGAVQAQRYCPHCARLVLATKRTPNHILHLLLTVLLFGFWLIVWFFVAVTSNEPYRCPICGSITVAEKRDAAPKKPMTVPAKIGTALLFTGIAVALGLAWMKTAPGARFGCTEEAAKNPFNDYCWQPSSVTN